MNLVNGGIVGVGLLNIRKNLKYIFNFCRMGQKWTRDWTKGGPWEDLVWTRGGRGPVVDRSGPVTRLSIDQTWTGSKPKL